MKMLLYSNLHMEMGEFIDIEYAEAGLIVLVSTSQKRATFGWFFLFISS